jgi:hypothetical protein
MNTTISFLKFKWLTNFFYFVYYLFKSKNNNHLAQQLLNKMMCVYENKIFFFFFILDYKFLGLNKTEKMFKETNSILIIISIVVLLLSCLTGSTNGIKCYKCKGDDECDFKTRSIYIENCTWATKCWVSWKNK